MYSEVRKLIEVQKGMLTPLFNSNSIDFKTYEAVYNQLLCIEAALIAQEQKSWLYRLKKFFKRK